MFSFLRGKVAVVAIDQAVVSAVNVLLLVLLARTNTPADFGRLALALIGFTCMLGITQGLNGQPLLVRASSLEDLGLRGAAASSLLLGLLTGVLFTISAALTHSFVLFLLACVAPLVALQDALRFRNIAVGRERRALLADLCWLLFIAGALVWSVTLRPVSSETGLVVFAVGASASVAVLGPKGILPTCPSLHEWHRATRHLGLRYVAEWMLSVGTTYVLLYAVGFGYGAVVVAGLRAAQAVWGPINVLLNASVLAGIPALVRAAGDPKRRARLAYSLSGAIAACALATGIGTLLVPSFVGRQAFGASWQHAHSFLVPLAIMYTAHGVGQGAFAYLRALEQSRATLRIRMLGSVSGLLLGLVGLAHSAVASLYGLAASALLTSAAFNVQVIRTERIRRTQPTSAPVTILTEQREPALDPPQTTQGGG